MTTNTASDKTWKAETFMPIIILVIAIPMSMVMWLGNVAFNIIKSGQDDVIPPTRWLTSTVMPAFIAYWGLKRKSLNTSGAFIGLFVGFLLTLSNYCFLICTLVCFVTSSQATKFKTKTKMKLEHDFKEGGQRNWIQVLCNAGMAAYLSVLYILEIGVGERPVDFSQDFRSSWLSIGVVGTLACATADTWASELGTVLSSSNPWLITTWKRVPKGVNGGVSLIGLFVSVLGGISIGVSFYFTIIYTSDSKLLSESPPQWPVIVVGGAAGLIGSVFDSFLGATLQYSGLDKKTGVIVEQESEGVVYICGRKILDNHSVNLLSTIFAGFITPRIANSVWPY